MADVNIILRAMSAIPRETSFIDADASRVTFIIDNRRILIVHASDADEVPFTYFFDRRLLASSVVKLGTLSNAMTKLLTHETHQPHHHPLHRDT